MKYQRAVIVFGDLLLNKDKDVEKIRRQIEEIENASKVSNRKQRKGTDIS